MVLRKSWVDQLLQVLGFGVQLAIYAAEIPPPPHWLLLAS